MRSYASRLVPISSSRPLFIADPIRGDEHALAVTEAKRVIDLLMNLQSLEAHQRDISVLSPNMDQRNVPTNANPSPPIKTHKARERQVCRFDLAT